MAENNISLLHDSPSSAKHNDNSIIRCVYIKLKYKYIYFSIRRIDDDDGDDDNDDGGGGVLIVCVSSHDND